MLENSTNSSQRSLFNAYLSKSKELGKTQQLVKKQIMNENQILQISRQLKQKKLENKKKHREQKVAQNSSENTQLRKNLSGTVHMRNFLEDENLQQSPQYTSELPLFHSPNNLQLVSPIAGGARRGQYSFEQRKSTNNVLKFGGGARGGLDERQAQTQNMQHYFRLDSSSEKYAPQSSFTTTTAQRSAELNLARLKSERKSLHVNSANTLAQKPEAQSSMNQGRPIELLRRSFYPRAVPAHLNVTARRKQLREIERSVSSKDDLTLGRNTESREPQQATGLLSAQQQYAPLSQQNLEAPILNTPRTEYPRTEQRLESGLSAHPHQPAHKAETAKSWAPQAQRGSARRGLVDLIEGFRDPKQREVLERLRVEQAASQRASQGASQRASQGTSQGASPVVQRMQRVHESIQSFLVNPYDTEQLREPYFYEMLADLKSRHAGFFTDAPSGRKEVGLLRQWLCEQLEGLHQEQAALLDKERIRRCDSALVICFNELLRQVSFHCLERGELLMEVFNCYFSVTQKLLAYENEEKNDLHFRHFLERKELTERFQSDVKEQVNLAVEYRERMVLAQEKLRQSEEESTTVRTQFRDMTNKIAHLTSN